MSNNAPSGWRQIQRLAWVPAFGLCVLGWSGITPLGPEPLSTRSYILIGAPHLSLIGVAFWAGRVNIAAVAVALLGSAIAAYCPWAEHENRRTEGFEWRFDSAVGFGMYCAMGYGVACLSAFGVLVMKGVEQALRRHLASPPPVPPPHPFPDAGAGQPGPPVGRPAKSRKSGKKWIL